MKSFELVTPQKIESVLLELSKIPAYIELVESSLNQLTVQLRLPYLNRW